MDKKWCHDVLEKIDNAFRDAISSSVELERYDNECYHDEKDKKIKIKIQYIADDLNDKFYYTYTFNGVYDKNANADEIVDEAVCALFENECKIEKDEYNPLWEID